MELLIVSLASLLAGLVDSIVGGGGLILLPALFATFPGAAPATLFGTNKSASIWGTAFATVQYSRKVVMPWRSLLPAAGLGLLGSLAGAWAVTQVDPSLFRKALPVLLGLLLIYTLAKKDLGHSHAPRFAGQTEVWIAAGIGLVIGFYDGFFGPGTGSFLVFAYVRLLGYDFLNASAAAKCTCPGAPCCPQPVWACWVLWSVPGLSPRWTPAGSVKRCPCCWVCC